MTVQGDPKPLPPSPCPLGPVVWNMQSAPFAPISAADTELVWLDRPVPWPVDYGVSQYQDATPAQYPFTVDLLYGGSKSGFPIETVEVTEAEGDVYTVIRGIGCKPPGDWPAGGDGAIYDPLGGGEE